MAWTVNNNREKDDFRQRKIPFLTDSSVEEKPEAWIPPKRKLTLSYLAQTSWSMLPVLFVSLIMLYVSLHV